MVFVFKQFDKAEKVHHSLLGTLKLLGFSVVEKSCLEISLDKNDSIQLNTQLCKFSLPSL